MMVMMGLPGLQGLRRTYSLDLGRVPGTVLECSN